jgi:hypothetical protein
MTNVFSTHFHKEVFSLKTILLVLFIICATGCSTTKIATGLDRNLEILGCPALVQWTAQELGIEENRIQIWMANNLSKDIQPCEACARFKKAAMVLQDMERAYLATLAQVINEFASDPAPPSAKQMESITKSIVHNVEAGNSYALVGEYLDAIATYQAFLIAEKPDFTNARAIRVCAKVMFVSVQIHEEPYIYGILR